MTSQSIILLVRDADDRYEEGGIKALTRHLVKQRYPDTEEKYLQERTLLVQHPNMNPKFSKMLIPADSIYTVMREQNENELFKALVNLGATEVELEQVKSEGEHNKVISSVNAGFKGAEGSISKEQYSGQTDTMGRKITLSMQPKSLNIEKLDKSQFFEELIYNSIESNPTLEVLFDYIKAGNKFATYQLEFKHSINRAYSLEIAISASYLKIFNVELNFKQEFERNRVEGSKLIAIFGSSEQGGR